MIRYSLRLSAEEDCCRSRLISVFSLTQLFTIGTFNLPPQFG